MVDVFLRCRAHYSSLIRQNMFLVCMERWLKEEGIRLHEVHSMDPRIARTEAEQMAQSPIYIFTDDDCLIVGKDWVKRGIEAMNNQPEYGIVSTLSLIEGENAAIPGYLTGDTNEGLLGIYPGHSVGQPMFVRKGICVDLPAMDFASECQTIHAKCEAAGYKEGLLNPNLRLRHNHMGHGFSGSPEHAWGW